MAVVADQTESFGASSSVHHGWGWDIRCEVGEGAHAGGKHGQGKVSTFASGEYKATWPEEHPCRVRWRDFAPSWEPPCYLVGQKRKGPPGSASCAPAEGLHKIVALAGRMPTEHEEPWVKGNRRGSGSYEVKGRPATKRPTAACDDGLPCEDQDREGLGGREGRWEGQMKEACQDFLAGSGRASAAAGVGSGCWTRTGPEVRPIELHPAA